MISNEKLIVFAFFFFGFHFYEALSYFGFCLFFTYSILRFFFLLTDSFGFFKQATYYSKHFRVLIVF